ncbi:MAG: 2,3-bisphosphoglycerate-independent phosphoglycerate mutase [Candidatus Moranbacteria bacterium]|nr:2,3-bisphosphoglycerate-independent phosphoglycerate mutase [Candidatus Moranbacteria bacterium]
MPERKPHTPVVLIVLDGWGYRDESEHNAIAKASTPYFDSLLSRFPHALVDASSGSVGLPEGQMGNSEVGHMTIGAGRIIDTDFVRISKAAEENEFATNPAFVTLFKHVRKHDSVLHVKGLVSPGGVHSHTGHLYAFLAAAKQAGVAKIAIHAFTDGRDVGPRSAATYLRELENVIDDIGIGFIATASGRFYAMDRDNNWDRVGKVENAIFRNEGIRSYQNRRASEVMEELYAEGVVDEHLEPVVFLDEDGRGYAIDENDGVFFFNFRSDRARELSAKTVEYAQEKNICFVTLTEYDPSIKALVAFPQIRPETTLAEQVSHAGLTQAHIAETEKYAHATYFLNGGRELPFPGEEQVIVESRKDVATHDQAPEMRAREIADKAIEYLDKGTDFFFINFANADMVGHTGNVPAIIRAVETVDSELSRVVEKTLSLGGIAVITADHGNAEQNVDTTTGETHTAHTTNLVPLIVTAPCTLQNGTLADIAPTTLSLMHLPIPKEMTGKVLSK